MSLFATALDYVTTLIYKPNQFTLKSILEEKQNAAYGAGTFQLDNRTIRFRVAKKTPKKIGQFVAFWEKDEHKKNQPFSYDDAPDLLVIATTLDDHQFGHFVFPKDILLKHLILQSSSTKGKMAIRVYPSWDHPTSKEALTTQQWQLPYFVDMSDSTHLPIQKTRELYDQ